MTSFPLNEEDFRMRLEESRRFPDPYVRRQYEIIRDAVEKVLTELLESVEKT